MFTNDKNNCKWQIDSICPLYLRLYLVTVDIKCQMFENDWKHVVCHTTSYTIRKYASNLKYMKEGVNLRLIAREDSKKLKK